MTVALALFAALCLGACGGGDKSDNEASSDSSVPVFGAVEVSGSPLPSLADGSTDSAVGLQAPMVTLDRASGETGVIGGPGQPTLVVFVAHWCPHCQAEVPVIVRMAKEGRLDSVRLVAVATGSNPQAPNYPPVAWLNREGWPAEILLDDKESRAASSFGLTSYPYLVAIDATGTMTGRASGEVSVAQISALVASAI